MISVVMSIYNSNEDYLKISINSILRQTYNNFEFIIINDSSTNNNIKNILNYFRSVDSRIILVENSENIGLTKSLNLGIKMARGKYIARMDDDDISMPDRLKVQKIFLEKNKDYVMVGSKYDNLIENKQPIQKVAYLEDFQEIRDNIIKFNPFNHSSVMIKRSVILDVGLYNEKIKYAQDYDLWLRVASKYKTYNINKVLLLRRMGSNISTLKEREQMLSALRSRIRSILKKQYPLINLLYLVRPFIAIFIPKVFRSYIKNI
jgi:glycosyltransferase involved in cell wall biosynthesis